MTQKGDDVIRKRPIEIMTKRHGNIEKREEANVVGIFLDIKDELKTRTDFMQTVADGKAQVRILYKDVGLLKDIPRDFARYKVVMTRMLGRHEEKKISAVTYCAGGSGGVKVD